MFGRLKEYAQAAALTAAAGCGTLGSNPDTLKAGQQGTNAEIQAVIDFCKQQKGESPCDCVRMETYESNAHLGAKEAVSRVINAAELCQKQE